MPENNYRGADKPQPVKAGNAKPERLIRRSPGFSEREAEPAENHYYIALAGRYRILKFMTLITLIVFCMGMIAVYRDDITVENFRYMLRDFDINSTKYTSRFDTITYSSGSGSTYALFKGDLAVASPDSLYIYGMSGSTEMSSSLSMTEPVIRVSDKYILVFDMSDSNSSYSIFNTFSILNSEKLDYQITGASVADNGVYAIATRTDEYKGAVLVYNSDFTLMNRILKDKHIMDVEMRPDGKEVLVLSAYDSGGDWQTELMTCAPGSDTATITLTLAGSMPVKASYSDAGGFTVLCDNMIVFYDSEGFEVSRYEFGSDIPVSFGLTGSISMVAFNKTVLGNEKTLLFWDGTGNRLIDYTLDGRIVSTAANGGRFFVQTNDKLISIEPGTGSYVSTAMDDIAVSLLVYSDEKLLLCRSDSAVIMDISSAAEAETTAAG